MCSWRSATPAPAAWHNGTWPSVYLIAKQGRLRFWWHGELNWQGAGAQNLMRKRIDQLTAEDYTEPADDPAPER